MHDEPTSKGAAGPIARVWQGRVPREQGDAYISLMETVGLRDYRSTPGNRGAYVLRRDEGDTTHVTMLTFWDSLDAVRAFAGDPVERAKYYDFDPEYLLELPENASHFAVHGEPDPLSGSGPRPAAERLVGAACTLDAGELRERLAEWRALRDRAVAIETHPGGVRLVFEPDEPLAEIGDLVARESECCSFYAFAVRVDGSARALEIDAGVGGEPAVHALLGMAG